MVQMITSPDDYFARGCGRCERFDTADCATRLHAGTLTALRDVCLDSGLDETAKWGHPCYTHDGRNVAIIGAIRDHVRLSFFEAGLLSDPDGLLERQGPNTHYPDMLRFESAEDVVRLATTVSAYLAEAKDHARAGRRHPRGEGAPDLPDTLIEALDADPDLAEAFHALTPGRQRGYVFHIGRAKTAQTQRARIDRLRDRILAGKGWNES